MQGCIDSILYVSIVRNSIIRMGSNIRVGSIVAALGEGAGRRCVPP